jgi:predicted CXXCH cytochrome family protein
MTRKLAVIQALVGLALLIIGLFLLPAESNPTVSNVQAQEEETPEFIPGDNTYCLVCHSNTDSTLAFADGTTASLEIGTDTIHDSVHGASAGEDALACSDCHQNYAYPHEPVNVSSQRAFTIQQSLNCTTCHEDQTENLADGVHYTALMNGNLNAATCVDCHGAHDVQPPDVTISASTESCGECHTVTFNEYVDSVHGEALFNGDENVPACVDCHGVHGIQHPTTALFRNRSPQLCATCHADADLMEEYDITTNVFDSYLSDFHGSTVSLFEQQDPNVATNKAVCYDCHGVHNITRADDSKSQVVRENLLTTCQKCHPGATSDFPASWVGHFEPTVEEHPLFFTVDLFYKILIPVVLGGFAFLVGTDIFRRIRQVFTSGGDEA